MRPFVPVLLVLVWFAGIARGDTLEGRVSLGVRGVDTGFGDNGWFAGQTTGVQVAADAFIGRRIGRVVLGLHAGVATPLHFWATEEANGGETPAEADSTVYALDVGLGAQIDIGNGWWAAGWVGTTASLAFATSPAEHVDAIDFSGDIPAASWSGWTAGLGYGATIGVDVRRQWAAIATFTSQSFPSLPFRANDGTVGMEAQHISCQSLAVAVAYRFL